MAKGIYGKTKRTITIGRKLDEEEFELLQRMKIHTGLGTSELLIDPAIERLKKMERKILNDPNFKPPY